MPWEAERCRSVELTDDLAFSRAASRRRCASRWACFRRGGRCSAWPTPCSSTIRSPVQGSNNASKGAAIYLQSILERGEGPFDAIWMQETFERLWEYAEKVVGWTNALLLPPPPHVLNVLGRQASSPPSPTGSRTASTTPRSSTTGSWSRRRRRHTSPRSRPRSGRAHMSGRGPAAQAKSELSRCSAVEPGHLGLVGAGGEALGRVEHAGEELEVSGAVQEDARLAEHPVDGEVDVRLLDEGLVPGRSRLLPRSPGPLRDRLDRLHRDVPLAADRQQATRRRLRTGRPA